MHLVHPAPFHRFYQVGRVAAYTHYHRQIPRPCIVFELAHKHILVSIIIADGCHPAYVIFQRKAAKLPIGFVGSTFAEVRNKMGGIGRTAAIAENKDLPVTVQGFLKCSAFRLSVCMEI
jgi:hypothetical protein